MNTARDELPRPNGVAEWIGTVIGLLLGVPIVVGAVALISVPFTALSGNEREAAATGI